ncbi:transcriptional regulator (plasmid) [Paraclostridium bifermentans]|uniref:Transcriptional regulator n=1 Tax=Paraclostridium bifermentans TaxID=1490 RepID=A0A5P3XKE7_PARBF|nr:helix-turn-helix transcriptional regulator [Paraclostridium bifermentans]QEZ70848.1 transcriptional regulator [Paraclostridium bifermentans]
MKNNLEEMRKTLGLTQEQLGDKLNVSRQTIISIESGRYNPSLELAFKIAYFFNSNIHDIFIFKEEV